MPSLSAFSRLALLEPVIFYGIWRSGIEREHWGRSFFFRFYLCFKTWVFVLALAWAFHSLSSLHGFGWFTPLRLHLCSFVQYQAWT